MSKQYKNTVYTKQFSREECKSCLDEIIEVKLAVVRHSVFSGFYIESGSIDISRMRVFSEVCFRQHRGGKET